MQLYQSTVFSCPIGMLSTMKDLQKMGSSAKRKREMQRAFKFRVKVVRLYRYLKKQMSAKEAMKVVLEQYGPTADRKETSEVSGNTSANVVTLIIRLIWWRNHAQKLPKFSGTDFSDRLLTRIKNTSDCQPESLR
jgi:hypothetical protein